MILMSPPCQPFTRNGLKGDNTDPRSCAFTHLLNILPELNIKYILIENVKGFETSVMHDKLISALESNDFTYQEFLLSPTQFGVSNARLRYYCLAKKKPLQFCFEVGPLVRNNTSLKYYTLSFCCVLLYVFDFWTIIKFNYELLLKLLFF